VDYADGMLAIAREKARALELHNIDFIQGDATAVSFGEEPFDAAMCVLGIFFIDDMPALASRLWSSLRPGGRLAVTTFGNEVFEPMLGEFVAEAARQQSGIEVILPWRRTENPDILQGVLEDGGVRDIQISEELNELPFEPDDWWNIVMGSGLRRTAELLGDNANRVRDSNDIWARANAIDSLRVRVNYAIAVKP
jgi:SAM-dependent methyltransferase